MVDLMFERLRAKGSSEPKAVLQQRLGQMVEESTGLQTIDQMQMLVDEIRQLGATGEDAARYKEIYLERLRHHTLDRLDGLRSGRHPASAYLLAGAVDFLQWLSDRGVLLCLISGTDERAVYEEARLLGIARFFGERIFGGLSQTGVFSKLDAMRRVLAGQQVPFEATIAFGDGAVDIRSAKQLGGLAIGVASDEENGRGLDPGKRRQLVAAGADAIIPDYLDFQQWIYRVVATC